MLQRIQSHLSFWKLWGGSNISRARTVYLPDLYILPISNGEKILSKVNVVVWGQVKSENSSLSFAVLTSKTRVLKFPNRSQKVSKCGKNVSETLGYRLQWHFFCSYHILTPSVIYYWTDAQQHGIFLLNSRTHLKVMRHGHIWTTKPRCVLIETRLFCNNCRDFCSGLNLIQTEENFLVLVQRIR